MGSIKRRATRNEDATTICMNVTKNMTALDVVVCALPTDVAYNRCGFWMLPSLSVALSLFLSRCLSVSLPPAICCR